MDLKSSLFSVGTPVKYQKNNGRKTRATNRLDRVQTESKICTDRGSLFDWQNKSSWKHDASTPSIDLLESGSMTHSNDKSDKLIRNNDKPPKYQPYNLQVECQKPRGAHKDLNRSTINGVQINPDAKASLVNRDKRVDLPPAIDSVKRIFDGANKPRGDLPNQQTNSSAMSCDSTRDDIMCSSVNFETECSAGCKGIQTDLRNRLIGYDDLLPNDPVATSFNLSADDQQTTLAHRAICAGDYCGFFCDSIQSRMDDGSPADPQFQSRIDRNLHQESPTLTKARQADEKLISDGAISRSTTVDDLGNLCVAEDLGITVNTHPDFTIDHNICTQNLTANKSKRSSDREEYDISTVNRLVGKGRLRPTVGSDKPPTWTNNDTHDSSELISNVNRISARVGGYKGTQNPIVLSSVNKQSNIFMESPGLSVAKEQGKSMKNDDLSSASAAAANRKLDEKEKEASMVAKLDIGTGITIKPGNEVSYELHASGVEINSSLNRRMVWKSLATKYGMVSSDRASALGQGQLMTKMRQSCCCNLLLSSLKFMFPIFSSMKSYSFPGDLVADLLAGFTVAILHIPQGMAYGLLAGVDPVYGLYVSLIPVLIMAFMSKSYHVSYGTFAVISMLLFNCQESVRASLRQGQSANELDSNFGYNNMINQTELRSMSILGGGNFRHDAGKVLSGEQADNLAAGNGLNGGSFIMTNNHKPQILYPTQEILKSLIPRLVNRKDFQSITDDDRQADPLAATATMSSINSDIVIAADEIPMPSSMDILTCICLVVGLVQITMAILRLGFLSLMFSDQLVSGFTTASAVHVMTSQLGGLFDLQITRPPDGLFKVCRTWYIFAMKMYDGFNQYTGLITLMSLLFLLSIKELVEPTLRRRIKSIPCLPTELILMAVLISCSSYWKFAPDYGILIVGKVPTGLPTPQVPKLDLVPVVLEDAFMIAVVSFAMNLSLAQSYAKKHEITLDPNQELFAVGATNLVSSFFSCFPCASSLSRSAVMSSLNVKSQLCPLISCTVVFSVICYFAPVFHDLPRSTLSCIIVVALRGILLQVKDFYNNWRLSKLDALIWAVTFIAVLALDVTYGLVIGIIASLVKVFYRLLTPTYSVLGQLPGTDVFVDKDAFSECQEVDRVKIFKFNSPLCYLNRIMFKSGIKKMVKLNQHRAIDPSLIIQQHNLKQSHLSDTRSHKINHFDYLIVDCSGLAYCDYSGASALAEIIDELKVLNITVFLAACPLKLITMFERMKRNKILEESVYPTIGTTINHIAYLSSKDSPQLQELQVSVG